MSTIGVGSNPNAGQAAEINRKAPAKEPEKQAQQKTEPAQAKDSFESKTKNAAGPVSTKVDLFSDEAGSVPSEAVKFDDAPKNEKSRRVTERKGTLAIGWGYGRQGYAPSDMHFKGPGHDFHLEGVKAYDRPSPFSFNTYFNPTKLSIPQYMMDITYFPTNNIYVELNPNHHMKWVADLDQMTQIKGHISPEASPQLAGDYNGEYIKMSDMFQNLEHSDGYNYVNAGVGVIHPLWESPNGKHALSIKGGVHAGAIVTRSQVSLFGKGENHPFKLDGFGYGAKAGVRLDLFKNFFIEGNSEFIRGHVSGFKTTGEPGATGKHTIDGFNNYFTVGYQNTIEKFNPANWFKK